MLGLLARACIEMLYYIQSRKT